MLDVFMQPFWRRVAESLLHFVWQGAAIAVALALVLSLGRFRQPQARYLLTLAALLAMAVCPLITFCLIEPPADPGHDVERGLTSLMREEHAAEIPVDEIAADGPVTRAGRNENNIPQKAESPVVAIASWRTTLNAFSPYIVTIWLLGGALLGCRLVLGAGALAWMTRRRARAPDSIAAILEPLCRRMNLKRRPRIFACERCPEAMAVGWLRPIVLIPAAWLSRVQPDVLEAVLAHELAHIQRRDMWVNLVQRILETVLFYHPAVWWVSNRLRTDREFRCDELAVAATGRRAGYAEALEWVARIGADRKSPVLAMTIGGKKMALLNRIRHVLKVPATSRQGGWLLAGFASLFVPALLWMALLGWNPLSADDNAPAFQGERGEKKEADEKPRREREERRERGERKEGKERRERGEREERGERGQNEERGERGERAERRERDERERGERRGEGDRREKGERREPDRRREGDRPRGDERRRDGDRGERRRDGDGDRGDRRRDGDRPPREGERRRDGDRDRGDRPRGERRAEPRGPDGNIRELLQALRQLRAEVAQLRKEVNELRGRREPTPRIRRPEDPRRATRRPERRREGGELDRPKRDRPDEDRKREADRPKRDRPDEDRKRETDRPRRDQPDRIRKREGDRPEREPDRKPEREKKDRPDEKVDPTVI